MAKISAHGVELVRYFDVKRHALMSARSDGVTLYKTVYSGGWKLYARKKVDVAFDVWRDGKMLRAASQPAWARAIKSLPSESQLAEWVSDCVCETPTGDNVEPDGHGPDGAPSWLLALGMV